MKRTKMAFAKRLLRLESLIVVYTTVEGFSLARLAVTANFAGSLPWIATMVTAAWGAYGASAAFYYNKAKAENTEVSVVYETYRREKYCRK